MKLENLLYNKEWKRFVWSRINIESSTKTNALFMYFYKCHKFKLVITQPFCYQNIGMRISKNKKQNNFSSFFPCQVIHMTDKMLYSLNICITFNLFWLVISQKGKFFVFIEGKKIKWCSSKHDEIGKTSGTHRSIRRTIFISYKNLFWENDFSVTYPYCHFLTL